LPAVLGPAESELAPPSEKPDVSVVDCVGFDAEPASSPPDLPALPVPPAPVDAHAMLIAAKNVRRRERVEHLEEFEEPMANGIHRVCHQST
jgi:hypothetical protein